MKSASKKRQAAAPAVVSAVEPLECRALFSVSPLGDSPTAHAVETVTVQNRALNFSTTSLNFTKVCYGLLDQSDV